MTTKQDGSYVENIAAEYLKRKLGFSLLYRNYTAGIGEIDIISVDKKIKTLHFTEVKSTNTDDLDLISNRVKFTKMRKYIMIAQIFQNKEKKYKDFVVSIDFAGVDKNTGKVYYFENILQ